MSFFKEPRPPTAKENAQQHELLSEQRLDHLLEEFFFTGDIDLLKEYVRRDGDIDLHGLRDVIADLIGAESKPNKGGSKDALNLGFFLAVEGRRRSIRRNPKITAEELADRPLKEQLSTLKKVGKSSAIREISNEWSSKGQGVSYEGGRSRYEKGKQLFIKKFGKV